MKKGIHPNWNKDVSVIWNGKKIMTVGSTREELNVEIWSGNHPFYTGQETLVDTDNLVEKFNKKLEKSKTLATAHTNSREKRRSKNKAAGAGAVTLKDMLKQMS